MRSIKIAPSILSADIAHLGRDLAAIATADLIHIDVMDGHFTGNLTFGPNVVAAAKRCVDVPLDVHMMVTNAESTVDWYLDAGADMITVHTEGVTHLHRLIHHIQDRGAMAGVVLNPATPLCVVEEVLSDVDMILLMSVNPGFGGQCFIPETVDKIARLRTLCEQRGVDPMIEVDGGVCLTNAAEIVRAGADVLVAGSAVYGADKPADAIQALREAAAAGQA